MSDQKEPLYQRLLDHEDALDEIHKRAIGLGFAITGAFEGETGTDGDALFQLADDLGKSLRKARNAFENLRADFGAQEGE
jgi:hypothetical protein